MKFVLLALVLAGFSGTALARNPELERCLKKCENKGRAAATICRSKCNADSGTIIPEKDESQEEKANEAGEEEKQP